MNGMDVRRFAVIIARSVAQRVRKLPLLLVVRLFLTKDKDQLVFAILITRLAILIDVSMESE